MKKINLIMSLILISFLLVACNKTSKTTTSAIESPTTTEYSYSDDFSYFEEMRISDSKKLYVYNHNESLNNEKIILLEAIQGIYARTNQQFYLYQSGSYAVWLNDLIENYGFTSEDITFNEMVRMFINDFGNKYVLYDKANNSESVNAASSISGIKDYLPVDVSIKDECEALGLEMGEDAQFMTEKECFNTYKDMFNNKGLVQLSPNIPHIRDYGIACKYFFYYQAEQDSKTYMFRGTVHSWLEINSPVFGWGPNSEDQHVTISSQSGQFTLASDYCFNMSVFTCKEAFGEITYTQKYKSTSLKAEPGKHYVTIMMSDGDNVQTWYNSFATSTKYMRAERGDFPMGWSIQPSLKDLAPNILNYVYQNLEAKDYLVCSVSGQGYIYPQIYPDLEGFCRGLSTYLRATDLSVVQILDSGPSDEVIKEYAKIPEVKGGIYCYGMKYAAGNGTVYFENDKPFVSIRETMWDANVESMAERINNYQKDPSTIDGYTAINLHPWSMTYNDVKTLVSLLDENVVVVSADDFIRLITENVAHVKANVSTPSQVS